MIKHKSTSLALGLAPMEGVTGLSTRLWFSMIGGITAMTTPFLRATYSFPLSRLPPDYVPELEFSDSHKAYSLMPQVMAAAPEDFLRAAKLLPSDQIIELNCGCPAPTSVGSGAGSALLRDPKRYHDFISMLCDKLGPGRLAVKMRLGLQTADVEFPQLFDTLAEKPLARLTIHGRTREERYLGKANWAWIEWAARHTTIPVFASGDILDEGTLLQLHQQAPSIQGALIGRGALRNPWFFWQLQQGAQPRVSLEVLVVALQCFVLLERLVTQILQPQIQRPGQLQHQNQYQSQKAKLIEVCRLVWDLGPSGISQEHWSRGLAALTCWSEEYPQFGSEKLEKVLLGRLKMVWNYLRSSLPVVFQDPTLLRVTTLDGFWSGLRDRVEGLGVEGRGASPDKAHYKSLNVLYPLSYQPHWDWVYGGGGKKASISPVLSEVVTGP